MKKWFEKICIGLIFFLSALLLMFFGIRTAGKTIAFARAERIEVINNLVDGISEGENLTFQGKKCRRWCTSTSRRFCGQWQVLNLFRATILAF